MNEYALVGAGVVVSDDLRFVRDGWVHVRDGRIVAVGEGQAPGGVQAIDLSGRLIVPGFINGHTHISDAAVKEIAYSAPPGTNLFFPPDGLRHTALAALDEATRIAAIHSAARHMISAGVVAFADFTAGGASGVRELRAALEGLPIRGLSYGGFAGAPQETDALESNRGGLAPSTTRGIIETLELADGFAPVRASDLTDQAMREVSALVGSEGKGLAIHAAATPTYRDVSERRTGRGDVPRIIENLSPDFMVHLTHATDDELSLAAEHRIGLVMCPRANVTLGAGLPPFASARERGADVALGTDNLMLGSPDILAELDFLSLATRLHGDDARVDASELLRAATIGAARAIGLDDSLGSITPGKSASLAIFDLRRDSLAYSVDPVASIVHRASAADISAVIIDGEVVHGAL